MSFSDMKQALEKLDCMMKYTVLEMSKLEPNSYRYNELLIALDSYYAKTKILLRAYDPLYFCFQFVNIDDVANIIDGTYADSLKTVKC